MAQKKNCTGLDLNIIACPDRTGTAVDNANVVSFAPAFKGASDPAQTSACDEDVDTGGGVAEDLEVDASLDGVIEPFLGKGWIFLMITIESAVWLLIDDGMSAVCLCVCHDCQLN